MGERRPATALDAQALSVLSKGAPVLLLSAGRDGQPHSTYSWAVAQDGACLRVGVDCGGRTSANWQHSRRAAVQLLGQGGLNLLIDGRATRLASALACTAEMEPWSSRSNPCSTSPGRAWRPARCATAGRPGRHCRCAASSARCSASCWACRRRDAADPPNPPNPPDPRPWLPPRAAIAPHAGGPQKPPPGEQADANHTFPRIAHVLCIHPCGCAVDLLP